MARRERDRQRARRAAPVTPPPAPAAARERVPGRGPFLGAIALSGVLLFTLELLSGRLVLPVFGGTPGVWATTLCFFTAVLLLGYIYAHVIATRLSPTRGGVVHLAVAGVVILLDAVAPRDVSVLRDPALPEVVNVLLAQAILAGPAGFLLASTSPLLSAWFARRGNDPWWLYAVSNGASFVGLLLYPFLIEPLLPLSLQRWVVTAGLVGLALTIGWIVRGAFRIGTADTPAPAAPAAPAVAAPAAEPPPTPRRQLRWLFAAFVPAGLLAATTNHIAVDLVSAPLIWIGPLAVYLLSFVVAFSATGREALPVINRLAPAAAALLWVPFLQRYAWPILPLLVVELGAFAILAIAIHGRLALDRPADRHLTRFYVVLSAGGMLATAFVAIVAPLVFSAVYEYPLLLVAALAALAVFPGAGLPAGGLRGLLADRRKLLVDAAWRVVPYAAVGAILVLLMAIDASSLVLETAIVLAVSGIAVLAAVSGWTGAAASAIVVAVLIVATTTAPLLQVRTFFGVLQVRNEGDRRSEYSGTTLHGTQFFDEPRRLRPTSYYVEAGPMGDVFTDLRGRIDTGAQIGLVGLGIGSSLGYSRPGDRWTIFEIDQKVIDIAVDPLFFTYLRDTPAEVRMVLGDARLSLVKEPEASFDVLVVDAFNSDAVPVHLLTREAMRVYRRVLRPGGVILFHLSNRFYDLIPVVNATARAANLGFLALIYQPGTARREEVAAEITSYSIVGEWVDIDQFRRRDWSDSALGPVFTDDYSNLLGALK